MEEFPQSHVEHCKIGYEDGCLKFGCKDMENMYDCTIDEDGELVITEK